MRNLIFLLMLSGILACSQAPSSSVLLTGTLENHEGVLLEFTYLNEFINNDRVVMDVEPDENGDFALAFDFDDAVFATIRAGRTNIPVFLEPGDRVHLEGRADDLVETIAFSGRGGNANNFLMAWMREVEPRVGDRFMAEKLRTLDPVVFSMLADSVAMQKVAFLDSWKETHDLSPVFVHFMESQIFYDKYQKLLEYPVMQQRLSQLQELPVMPEGYFDFLEEDGLFDDSRLNSPVYVQFLMNYLSFYQLHVGATMSADMSLNQFFYQLAAEAIPGASGEYIQAVYLSRELNYGELETAENIYNEFMENSKEDAFKKAVTDTYKAIISLNPGNPAPDFTMTDIHGQEVSLSDFRGKVVYLDFWASWCGPCMREMPYFRELKQRLADQEDLVYLYISIDTDEQAWRNSVERNQITGVHLNTPGRERGVPAMYNVKWIPSFFIIGRDGNIYDNRPPKPSDPEIDQALLEALAQEV
jgi:thiol-disulfide isomerase/thioredoxin